MKMSSAAMGHEADVTRLQTELSMLSESKAKLQIDLQQSKDVEAGRIDALRVEADKAKDVRQMKNRGKG